MTRRYFAIALLLCATCLSAACRRPVQVPAAPAASPVVPEAPPAPPAAAAETPAPPEPSPGLSEEEEFARKTLEQLNAEMPLSEVYFDLDQSSVRDDQREVLQRNTAWLQRWPSTRVTAEGHGDARGTNEYNLALGSRRSQSTHDYIVALGVSSSRLAVSSKGEETPVCDDEGEDCWQRNRRVRFVITAK